MFVFWLFISASPCPSFAFLFSLIFCLPLAVNAAGAIATQPSEAPSGMRLKARSMYGGLANSLGVSLSLPLVIQEGFRTYVHSQLGTKSKRKLKKGQTNVLGLCAVLHVSGTLHSCAKGQTHELAHNLFLSNVAGQTLTEHLVVAGSSLINKHPKLFILCNRDTGGPIFGETDANKSLLLSRRVVASCLPASFLCCCVRLAF